MHSLYDGVDLSDGVREKELVGPYSAIGLLEDCLYPVHQDAQGMSRCVEGLRSKHMENRTKYHNGVLWCLRLYT